MVPLKIVAHRAVDSTPKAQETLRLKVHSNGGDVASSLIRLRIIYTLFLEGLETLRVLWSSSWEALKVLHVWNRTTE